MSDDKIVRLPIAPSPDHREAEQRQAFLEIAKSTTTDSVEEGVDSETSERVPRPQWAAVGAFITLMVIALVASVLVPPAPGGGIRWNAAFALLLAGFCAVLVGYYRFNRDAWR